MRRGFEAQHRSGRAAALGALGVLATAAAAAAQPAPVVQVAVGHWHSCALTEAGEVWCWGLNDAGQLGDGTTQNRLAPVRVDTSTPGFRANNIVAITAAFYHTCALNSVGRAFCWGGNFSGQLGDGTVQTRLVPTPVDTGTPGFGVRNIAAISAGDLHSCALTTQGRAFCWGGNASGQLGDDSNQFSLVPVPVSTATPGFGARNIATIAAGGSHTCAITTRGRAFCWGDNAFGSVGDGTTQDRLVPTPVDTATPGFAARNIATIIGAERHSCAVTTQRRMFCWGYNTSGAIGDGTAQDRLVPTPVSRAPRGFGPRNVLAMAAGRWHSCAVTDPGRAWCWGWNNAGKLGDGTTSPRYVPTPVDLSAPWLGPRNVAAMAGGFSHSCAITDAGRAFCWGDNALGQLGDGTGVASPIPVEVAFPRG